MKLDKHQAEAAGEALLAPHRERHDTASARKLEKEQQARTQRRRGAWAVAGLFAGAAAGYFVAGSIWPGAMIGMFAGLLSGVLYTKQADREKA